MYTKTASELTEFIKASPTPFHAVASIARILEENGFHKLSEGNTWNVEPGNQYYVIRNNSSIIALKIGTDLKEYGFNVAASHSDSPTFKIKENAEIEVKKKYTKLNTEGYGGMLCSTWFDRPLSIAGRAIVKTEGSLETKLINIDRDLLMIPSLAIHMDREVNNGHAYNKQVDMLPLFSGREMEKGSLKKLVASELGVKAEDIYGTDLFLYNRMQPTVWGAESEFISCPQLDDLQCAYASLQGFLKGGNEKSINVYACFDNEEVGSGTKQGAASTMLYDTLFRINLALGKEEEDYYRALAGGSTLGNITMSKVSMNAVDIGLAQLAMHSSYETAGVKDTCYLIQAAEELYNSHMIASDEGKLVIEQR